MAERRPFAHTFKVVEDEHRRLSVFCPTLANMMVEEYEKRKAGQRPRLNSSQRHYLNIILEYPPHTKKNILTIALNLNSMLVQYERHSSPAVKYLAEAEGMADQWERVPPGFSRKGRRHGT